MKNFTRREFIGTGAAVAGAAAAGGLSPLAMAQTPSLSYTPEPGAKLRVLRWKRFVQGDEDQFMANVAAFSKKYGVEVRVDNEGWEDVRPKAAVSASGAARLTVTLAMISSARIFSAGLIGRTVPALLIRQISL